MTTATLDACAGRDAKEAGGQKQGKPLQKSGQVQGRVLSCKGKSGEPCEGMAREVSPAGISLQGGHWEEEPWAGLCPKGTGMMQHQERAWWC